MLRDFNLLVTTTRGNEVDACSEIWYLLNEIGDNTAKVDKTGVSGLISAKTIFGPLKTIRKLRDMLRKRPYEFRFSLRIIPIQQVTQTSLTDIKSVIAKLASEIDEKETFRITVEKRFSQIPSKDIIEASAESIERKVNLTKPDKIVLIEVIGGFTGISVIQPSDIISVMKEKFESGSNTHAPDYR
ncbi:MAG: THUMP domain-containing protein [Candidatus Bathyarchaeota archaeon]|nr:MAG: THUMP domain-containing protein [Candidatus Bathyarchaeota archaeon]